MNPCKQTASLARKVVFSGTTHTGFTTKGRIYGVLVKGLNFKLP